MSSPRARALQRVERQLLETPVLESFIARREMGNHQSDDAETADAVLAELLLEQRPDGSWDGNLGLTAERLLLLWELRPFPSANAVRRALAWLRTRQNAPGVYTEGCTPERHEQSLCHHYAAGFFSPGPSEKRFAGTVLSSGTTLAGETDARLALSALALRAVLLWQERASLDDSLQLDALRRIAAGFFRHQSLNVATPAALVVLGTLADSREQASLEVLQEALSRLTRMQRADGSWPDADAFHVADTLLRAARAGCKSEALDAAIVRTAGMFAVTQHEDGTWGQDLSGPRRSLVAWRTLRYAAEATAAQPSQATPLP